MTLEPPLEPVAVRAVAGYDESFDALFALAYRVAYRILGSRDEAGDVASEALARTWAAWRRIDGHASAWVARVSGNLAISVVRRHARASRLPFRPSAPAPAVSELRHDLTAALRRLPRRQRQVLVLRYLADLSEPDVAAALGCSVGTVKQHAHRALAALRLDTRLDQEER